MKQPYEAQSFKELEELLTPTLNGEKPIEFITRLLSMRHRQREGDHRRNRERRAQLRYMNSHPELKKKALKAS